MQGLIAALTNLKKYILYIYVYVYISTYTHIHTYINKYVYTCVCPFFINNGKKVLAVNNHASLCSTKSIIKKEDTRKHSLSMASV